MKERWDPRRKKKGEVQKEDITSLLHLFFTSFSPLPACCRCPNIHTTKQIVQMCPCHANYFHHNKFNEWMKNKRRMWKTSVIGFSSAQLPAVTNPPTDTTPHNIRCYSSTETFPRCHPMSKPHCCGAFTTLGAVPMSLFGTLTLWHSVPVSLFDTLTL